MPATVAQLGAGALRKLGVAIVADAARPGAAGKAGPGATRAASDLEADVLREFGVVVPETARPAALGSVPFQELAARALRSVGGNPIPPVPHVDPLVSIGEIASRALRSLGSNPAGPLGLVPGDPFGPLSNVAYRALLKLGVMASDEPALPEDQAAALTVATSVHAALLSNNIADWSADAVPARAQEHLVSMVAALLAPSFGKAVAADAYLLAEEKLRVQALSGFAAQQRAEAEVVAVHNRLHALGLADWPVEAIPASAVDGYVAMVASALAPVYGKPDDPNAVAAAEAMLRRRALSGIGGQRIAESKVLEAHEALNAQGLVSWALNAIPAAFAADYVAMAASLLGPAMGRLDAAHRQLDEAAWSSAMGRVRAAGQVRQAQQRARDRIASVHAELNALGLVTWNLDAIPAGVAQAYVALAVEELAPSFGRKADPAAREAAMARVRRIVMGGVAGQALAEQKVRAVHAELDARGRTRWFLADLPDYAEEPYVLMAAVLLAPEVGAQADPSWWQGGERMLIRAVALPTDYRPVVAAYF